MSNVAIAEISMERCLLDNVPYEILFEIFRKLPKGKLIEISGLSTKFRDIAGDTRLWKNVYIKYKPYKKPTYNNFAFEELYSEPWPVDVIDLSDTRINPPVSLQTDQVIKVATLDLSSIAADTDTIKAILTRYQCTELYLDSNNIGIVPEAFSKQLALEVLSLRGLKRGGFLNLEKQTHCVSWLASVLSNCKNLKLLDLCHMTFVNSDLLEFVESLPTSLEKLCLADAHPEDSFFKLLAESTPNLTDLRLCPKRLKCPSLVELQFLEALHFSANDHAVISDLYMYLIKFPALKTVCMYHNRPVDFPETNLEKLRMTLKPHGIIVTLNETPEWAYPVGNNLWQVSKSV